MSKRLHSLKSQGSGRSCLKDPVLQNISQRIEAFTGLSLQSAEQFQARSEPCYAGIMPCFCLCFLP